ncbi:MAG: hypothetical protein ABR567_09345 [Myxococcales bacterium]|nr:hypothetical protein [Myxococcales bacterium]
MTAREYIETVALELGKVRGRGLVLSPADAQLALSWHAAQVPLAAVIAQVRRAARLKARGAHVRGAAEPGISLQAIAESIEAMKKTARARPVATGTGLAAQLKAAARAPGLAARAAWESLAELAEELEGGDAYWTAAVDALKAALRELPRSASLKAGAALRARLAPRPRGMPRRRYQRSLQLMLLAASSEQLGLPPRAFLL